MRNPKILTKIGPKTDAGAGMYRLAWRELAPPFLRRIVRYAVNWRHRMKFRGLSRQAIFSRIYMEGHWGRPSRIEPGFSSGTGSHDEAVVEPYVAAVGAFLDGLSGPPAVVDLGCGDFAVGARLRSKCSRYVACDIVPALLAWNRERFSDLGVEFRHVDIVEDALPCGEVAFVRQVLQHLNNAEIGAITDKLAAFPYLIVTEHHPAASGFIANVDKPAGPDTRLDLPIRPSGVVLTEPPFRLAPMERRVLVEVASDGGVVRTMLYRMR